MGYFFISLKLIAENKKDIPNRTGKAKLSKGIHVINSNIKHKNTRFIEVI